MKVFHEKFGEGQIINSTEKLDESGNMVSADVMFEHGIVRDMNLSELSEPTKASYRKSAFANKDYHKDAHSWYSSHKNPSERNPELAKQSEKIVNRREKGIALSYAKTNKAEKAKEDAKQFHAKYNEKHGGYDIAHKVTGKVVAHNIAGSGGAALAAADRYNSRNESNEVEEGIKADMKSLDQVQFPNKAHAHQVFSKAATQSGREAQDVRSGKIWSGDKERGKAIRGHAIMTSKLARLSKEENEVEEDLKPWMRKPGDKDFDKPAYQRKADYETMGGPPALKKVKDEPKTTSEETELDEAKKPKPVVFEKGGKKATAHHGGDWLPHSVYYHGDKETTLHASHDDAKAAAEKYVNEATNTSQSSYDAYRKRYSPGGKKRPPNETSQTKVNEVDLSKVGGKIGQTGGEVVGGVLGGYVGPEGAIVGKSVGKKYGKSIGQVAGKTVDKAVTKWANESIEVNEELSHEAHELIYHADNHPTLHKSSHEPITKNLRRKAKAGKYDAAKAKTLWGYHADKAAQSYAKEHGDGTPWHQMFPTHVRKQAASHWESHHRDEVHEGYEYNLEHLSDGDADEEGSMAKNQMATADRAIKTLNKKIKDKTQLPAWVQSKITNGADQLDTVADYMSGKLKKEEVEQVDELSKGTMGSYIRKSAGDASNMAKYSKDSDQKIERRHKGIRMATNKLTKEELEAVSEAKASPITGTRLISKHEGKDGYHTEVRYNPEWQEHSVHHYHNNKHLGEGPVSYHGSGREGREDATDTAHHNIRHNRVINGKVHSVKEEVERVDEKISTGSASYNEYSKRYGAGGKKLSPGQQKIASIAGNPNKIDSADLAKLRNEETMTEETRVVTPASAAMRMPAVESAIRDIMGQKLNLRQIAKENEFKNRNK